MSSDGGGAHARVIFRQRYRSNTFHDEVRKRVTLAWTGSAWKIVGERVVR